MKKWLRAFCVLSSALIGAVVCVFWLRGRTGWDEASWSYDRYLADGSAASSQVRFTSSKRLTLSVSRGHVGPYDGQLVWGYHMNADRSGGRPQFHFFRQADDPTLIILGVTPDSGTSGWGPVRWQTGSRLKQTHGDDSCLFQVGVSHWVVAVVSFLPAVCWVCRRCRRDFEADDARSDRSNVT